MTPEQQVRLQEAVFRRTADDPTWLGYWLARHRQTERLSADQLAAVLGVSRDALALLCLCRTPRPDQFADDLSVICRRTGADELALAQLVRQQQTLHAWSGEPTPRDGGWLIAASDRVLTDEEPGPPPPRGADDDTPMA